MRIAFAAALALSASLSGAEAAQVWLTMDQVRPYVLERPAGEIVVGNPAVADVTVQDKNRILLFGKAPGLTNMYVFDDEGNTIDNLVIRVRASGAGLLTMQRGVLRTTYNCTDLCETTLTVGDNLPTFQDNNTQVQMKVQQVQNQNNAQ